MQRTHLLIVGGTAVARRNAARAQGGTSALTLDAVTLPFIRLTRDRLPRPPRVLVLPDVERACPNRQTGGARLVLTQSTYFLQTLVDLLDEGDRLIVTADRAALERDAAEALQARGPWNLFEVVALGDTKDTTDTKDTKEMSSVSPVVEILAVAFRREAADERIRLCQEAVALSPDAAVAHLALASACREAGDMTAARAALDRAAALAPEWEAVHFESGKWWLASDDMEQARAAFQRACEAMPTFSAAFSNLGATLGELEEPDAALAAFRQALVHDPRSFTVLNNIGVVSRELGRLDESEAALRRVIELAPDFVFGHYNLGHTLFLSGQYAAALAAYEEGRRRDPQKNVRQACRLAMVRLATGDAAAAERALFEGVNAAPPNEREDLLLEAYEIAQALLASHPALEPHRPLVERIADAIVGRREPRG